MKTAKVYNHYIWIINTLMAYGSLTLAELSRKWQEDKTTASYSVLPKKKR